MHRDLLHTAPISSADKLCSVFPECVILFLFDVEKAEVRELALYVVIVFQIWCNFMGTSN